jgi:hypothetical protein
MATRRPSRAEDRTYFRPMPRTRAFARSPLASKTKAALLSAVGRLPGLE